MKNLIISIFLCLLCQNLSAQNISLIKDELNHQSIAVSAKFTDIDETRIQFSATILPTDTVYALHLRISKNMPYVSPGATVRLKFDEGSLDLKVLAVKNHEASPDFDLTIPYDGTRIVAEKGVGEYSKEIKTEEIQNPESSCDMVYLCCPMNAIVLQAFRDWTLNSIQVETVKYFKTVELENAMILNGTAKRMHKIVDELIYFCRNLK